MRDAEFEQRLLRVARGLEKADLVLKGGNVFNSFTGEWETADVAVCGSVIAGIGSYKGAEMRQRDCRYRQLQRCGRIQHGGQIFNAGLSGRAYTH